MSRSTESKPLRDTDESAVAFVREMLGGDPTYGINFDRLQWDEKKQKYVIVEYLRAKTIDPYKSHPNNYYWSKRDGSYGNRLKFLRLWAVALDLGADLILVNYASKGTEYEDRVLVMRVLKIDENDHEEPIKTQDYPMTRAEFKKLFRDLNRRGNVIPEESDKLILRKELAKSA